MKQFIFFFILITITTIYSQGTWQFLNPGPVGNNLYAAKFVDNNTVFVTGDGGDVLKSTNAGANWTQQNTGTMRTYCGISNYDASHIVLASYSKYTVLTTNKGVNWITYTNSNIGVFYQLNDFTYLNTRCYTDANTMFSNFTEYYCFKSTNGGINFTSLPVYCQPREIYFINSTTGWIYNDSGIYKSTDGGVNFSRQRVQRYSGFRNFSFLNENFGVFLGNQNPVLITTNGGTNWVSKTLDSSGKYFRVDFVDSNTIYLCRDSGIVCKSTNRGNNWVNLYTGYNESLYGLNFINSNTGVVVGATGCILVTNNGGLNWNQKRAGLRTNIESFYFFNQNAGFFVGGAGFLAKTTNGGANLSTVNTGQSFKFFGISFYDQNTGYIVGEQGGILKTTNGGNNWQLIYSNPNIWLIDIRFINPDVGFAVGSKQTILKTTNGGTNWFVSYQGVFDQMQFLKVKFLNDNTGFVSGEYLYKTTDCGSSWTMAIPPDPNNLNYFNDIDFYGNTIYAIKYNSSYNISSFLYSTNNGSNWAESYIASYYDFTNFVTYGLDFISDSVGYICGQGNTIIKTTNKGSTWIAEQSSIYPSFVENENRNRLKKIQVFDTSYIITAGQRGIILRKGSPVITSINKKNSLISDSYILYQNYQNPFNPSTIIRYKIPRLSSRDALARDLVLLRVYNILGKEVATLVNEKQSPGVYEVTFDGSTYPSGVYFYQLSIGNVQCSIKKMVLIK